MRISRPRCPLAPAEGAVGQDQQDTDTDLVGALIETHSPRATQIVRAKHKTSLLFMIYFKTTPLMIREICLLTTRARTGDSQA